jgi:L-threonylcarbamoyladenylate synthase
LSGPDLLTIPRAVQCLQDGRLIAYPTEAVFGLGCDPRSELATRKLLALKNRPAGAGLILIADSFDRFEPYIEPQSETRNEQALTTWPGPVTWLFPRKESVPDWLAGNHSTIAIRVTAHPVCRALCGAFGGPIISTSANPSGQGPARFAETVDDYFGTELCGIVAGELGRENQPSEIRDLATGRVLREK